MATSSRGRAPSRICLASALLSALMSNTAAVTMLIPLAAGVAPAPSTAILVAISASLGIPFVISTPPNAMVYGEGGIAFYDLSGTGTDSYGVGL